MRKIPALGLVAVPALVLAACSGGGAVEADGGGEDLETVRLVVANPSAVAFYPIFTAIDRGYFEEEGLEVTVEPLDGSAGSLQALASGQADIGTPGPGPLLGAREGGEDVVFFYNLTPRNIFSLVVPESSGVTKPEDLRDKTIGLGTADGAERALVEGIFTEAGMTEGEDYEFLTVGDGGLATAGLQRGDIDAYAASIVDVAIIGARGTALTDITPDSVAQLFSNGLAAQASYIDENPETIEAFGRAVARATEWGAQNKDEALKIAAEANPEEGTDPELASALFDITVHFGTPFDGNELGYNPPEAWEAWETELVETGDLDGPVEDLESAYTNEFVDAYNES
jgi:NitT/TauT family transport system substrate-binding protein